MFFTKFVVVVIVVIRPKSKANVSLQVKMTETWNYVGDKCIFSVKDYMQTVCDI